VAVGRAGSARTGRPTPPDADADADDAADDADVGTDADVDAKDDGAAVAWRRVRTLRSLLDCTSGGVVDANFAAGVVVVVVGAEGEGEGMAGREEETGGPRGGVGRRGGRAGIEPLDEPDDDDDDAAAWWPRWLRLVEGDARAPLAAAKTGWWWWDWEARVWRAREMALDHLSPSSRDSANR
jgi:hypothetical protein